VGFLLFQFGGVDVGVGNDTNDGTMFFHTGDFSVDVFLTVGVFFGVLGKGFSFGLVPEKGKKENEENEKNEERECVCVKERK
jgi:hypothetical protein